MRSIHAGMRVRAQAVVVMSATGNVRRGAASQAALGQRTLSARLCRGAGRASARARCWCTPQCMARRSAHGALHLPSCLHGHPRGTSQVCRQEGTHRPAIHGACGWGEGGLRSQPLPPPYPHGHPRGTNHKCRQGGPQPSPAHLLRPLARALWEQVGRTAQPHKRGSRAGLAREGEIGELLILRGPTAPDPTPAPWNSSQATAGKEQNKSQVDSA